MDDYYSTREETIDFYHKLSKKIAKLRLRGISSWKPKHYKLMYALSTGTLIPPSAQRALWDPNAYPGTSTTTRPIAMKRGLFNPYALFGYHTFVVGKNEDPFIRRRTGRPITGPNKPLGMFNMPFDQPDDLGYLVTET